MNKTVCMISVHGDPLGVLGTPDTGGQCLYIKEIAKKLIHLGYRRIDSYTRHWGEKLKIETINNRNNCRVIRIPCGTNGFIPKEQLKPYLEEFFKNMKNFILSEHLSYDLVHSHYWDGGLVGNWVAEKYTIPQVHTSHSLGAVKKATAAKTDTLEYQTRIDDETQIYTQSTAIIAESKQEIHDLQSTYSVPKDKIHLIPAGFDNDWFFPRGSREKAKKKLGFTNEVLILSLGRLDPRKGFDLLIKGVPTILNELKKKKKEVKVVISAGNKDRRGNLSLSASEKLEYDKLTQLSEKLGITDHFQIIPRIDFELVPVWYTAADVFTVPSRYETFGLVIVEAMACETPIVATNIGGPPDIITDGIEGFTENPEEYEEFSKKILEVIQTPDKHARFCENARKTANEKFSWLAVTQQIDKLYVSLIKD